MAPGGGGRVSDPRFLEEQQQGMSGLHKSDACPCDLSPCLFEPVRLGTICIIGFCLQHCADHAIWIKIKYNKQMACTVDSLSVLHSPDISGGDVYH